MGCKNVTTSKSKGRNNAKTHDLSTKVAPPSPRHPWAVNKKELSKKKGQTSHGKRSTRTRFRETTAKAEGRESTARDILHDQSPAQGTVCSMTNKYRLHVQCASLQQKFKIQHITGFLDRDRCENVTSYWEHTTHPGRFTVYLVSIL